MIDSPRNSTPKTNRRCRTRFAGPIKFVHFEALDSHDCIACNACSNICPSACIKVEGGKVEGIKRKRPSLYEMDFAACSLCGLCIDVCPTETLEWGKAYDDAGYTPNWIHDLMAPHADKEDAYRKAQAEREAVAAAEKKKKAEARAKAKAEKAAAAKAKKAAAEQAEAAAEKAEAAPEDADTATGTEGAS